MCASGCAWRRAPDAGSAPAAPLTVSVVRLLDLAYQLLRESVLPYVKTVTLAERDVMAALAQAKLRGVRGGAVYGYLHLAAARKFGAEALVTLDSKHFAAFVREGDPRVEGV